MRYKLYWLFSLLLAFVSLQVPACPWFRFSPRDYRMFRAPEYAGIENELANCNLWKSQLADSAGISTQDIYKVVYKSSLADLEALAKGESEMAVTSGFAKALAEDREAMTFLLLAKQCEEVRAEMVSPWYYSVPDDMEHRRLEEIAEKAQAYSGSRFKSRYALQAERALLTLHRYDDCIRYWDSVENDMPDDVVARMAMGNVAGAYDNIGDTLKAAEYYARSGQVEYCGIEMTYRYNPDASGLRRVAAEIIESAEREREENGEEWGEWAHLTNYVDYSGKGKVSETTRSRLSDFRSFCLKAASGGKVSDPAYWYYAAAYIEHLLDDNSAASRTLARAERSGGSEDVRESIKVLRIYLDSMLMPVTSAYVPKMVENLRWLDGKIVRDTAKVEKDYLEWKINTNRSCNYWNDMMRKIVLSGIVPKLLDGGEAPFAFAFSEMADSRLLSLMGEKREYSWSNATFKLLDSLDISCLVRYAEMLERPRTSQEYFLVSRGGTDTAYVYDIIGTRLLREMRYQEAEKWLSRVPVSFNDKLHTRMDRNPFSLTLSPSEEGGKDFKYRFAREMASLEQAVASPCDPDRKALMLLKLATGMKSSITQCWPLTFYGKNSYDTDPECPPTPYSKAVKKILKRADELFLQARRSGVDPEVKARIQLALGNTRAVMEYYPSTSSAESIRGKCDTYYDYRLDKDLRAGYGQWVTPPPSGKKKMSQEAEKRAEYRRHCHEKDAINSVFGHDERESISGRFNGRQTDTLTIRLVARTEYVDSDLFVTFNGKRFKDDGDEWADWRHWWEVTSSKGTVPPLRVYGLCPLLVYEGDLDWNGTDEFGILFTWHLSYHRSYSVYTFRGREWRLLIPPVGTAYSLRASGKDLVRPGDVPGEVRVTCSDFEAPMSCYASAPDIDTILTPTFAPIE